MTPPSLFTESVKLDINGATVVAISNAVPDDSTNFIYNNKDVGPTPGTQYKNEIASDAYITFPDTSTFYFQIDLNTVLSTITPFISPDYNQSVSLTYPGAYFNFYQTDSGGNIILQGSGTPTGFDLNVSNNGTVPAPVPVPSTLALFVLGLFGMIRQGHRITVWTPPLPNGIAMCQSGRIQHPL